MSHPYFGMRTIGDGAFSHAGGFKYVLDDEILPFLLGYFFDDQGQSVEGGIRILKLCARFKIQLGGSFDRLEIFFILRGEVKFKLFLYLSGIRQSGSMGHEVWKSTSMNSSHVDMLYVVFSLKKKYSVLSV